MIILNPNALYDLGKQRQQELIAIGQYSTLARRAPRQRQPLRGLLLLIIRAFNR